jgi:hypothetical protein
VRRQLVRWNRAPAPPIVVPADIRQEISLLLADDIELLSTLIGRNLDHWLDGALSARTVAEQAAAHARQTRFG